MPRLRRVSKSNQRVHQMYVASASILKVGANPNVGLLNSCLSTLERQKRRLVAYRRASSYLRPGILVSLTRVNRQIAEIRTAIEIADAGSTNCVDINVEVRLSDKQPASSRSAERTDKSMTSTQTKDDVLKQYLPQIKKLVDRTTLVPSPSRPTQSKLELRAAIEAAEKGVQKRAPKL